MIGLSSQRNNIMEEEEREELKYLGVTVLEVVITHSKYHKYNT